MKKLNLKWVSETIGEDYLNWKKGDMITIQAQTGTGKTYFIKDVIVKNLNSFQKLLYICNRIDLKRQIKNDLFDLYEMEKPKTLEELDKVTKIGNCTITSYHSISSNKLNSDFLCSDEINLEEYDYIICDECHFFQEDSSFNNKTHVALERLLCERCKNSIKIFISATMDGFDKTLENALSKLNETVVGTKAKFYRYSTGIDYSYINPYYFKKLKDIQTLIKNDTTDEKWIVFVNSKKDGQDIYNFLGKEKSFYVDSDGSTDENEIQSIINNSKFNKKVLITTKCLDNGVNIADEKLTNVVIMTKSKTTFIQELGRVRININNPRRINLYISTFYQKSFRSELTNLNNYITYKEDYKWVDFYNDEPEEFKKVASHSENMPKKLLYIDKNDNWQINYAFKSYADKRLDFLFYMIDMFKEYKDYAYVMEQLKWIGKSIDEAEEIEDVLDNEDIDNLDSKLQQIYNNNEIFLTCKDREPLIEIIGIIDGNHSNLKEGTIKYVKNINSLNGYLEEINSAYRIKQFETSRIINGKKKKFKNAWKIIK